MNICPSCESEMEQGLKVCPDCSPEDMRVPEDPEERETTTGACLELEGGQRFDLGASEILLGRRDPIDGIEPEIDLSIHGGFEQGVSRRHAVIRFENDGYVLEDLGSTNGTVLNRDKIHPGHTVDLVEGDVIYLGHLKAVFHTGAGREGLS